ncbi:hypothetical protein MN032_13465 [Agromyces atrinae]|uniref:hypothetical protein n=1 Tax=Agromyces atrinae TaxID=592376 RepID=UPI001F592F63|nr:hypothetical protein [Agromyces atrinae]MCI2958705.1 hypothetical protein [Agromyces atrinae]
MTLSDGGPELAAQPDDLAAALAALRAENAELTRQLAAERSVAEGEADPSRTRAPRRGRGRAVLASVLVVLGTLLAPVAVVSTWAQRELTDTAYFVDTFAPLAEEPAVQAFVAAEAVTAIESAIDIDQIADDLFAGLEELELEPRAAAALGLLKAPAVSGVKGLIDSAVTEFVSSDAFAAIWEDALEVTHAQLVSTATGKADAAVTVGPNQELSLHLGPIIRAVREQLVAEGFALAADLPEISRTIVIAESSSVGLYLTIYQLVVAIGIWLPWISLLLLVAGVAVARRRSVALVWTAGALLVTMVLVGAGIGVGTNIFALAVSSAIPHDAAVVLYSGVLGFVSDIVTVVGVLAATVLVIALLNGPWSWARTVRRAADAVVDSARRRAESSGITTGAIGERIHDWRVPLRVVVGLGCAAFLVLARPLTPGEIIGTAIVGGVLVAILELVSRPPHPEEKPA